MTPGFSIRALADAVAEGDLFDSDATVVVGVSGGPDSMALLHGLCALNHEQGFSLQIHVAHVNHMLRGFEVEKDVAFVQAAADSLGLPCSVHACDVASMAKQRGQSVEEAAREERYHFFERVCLQIGSQHAAVGHHSDDHAETILFRILRGTGLRGLGGIPVHRPISPMSDVRIVRPLLRFSRAQIVEFLSDRGVPYREDRTNASTEPMRNRIRHLILPQLEAEVNPQVRDALIRLGEQARWVEEYLNETAQRTLETLIISRTDQSLTLNAASLGRKSRIIQTELVWRSVAVFEIGQQDLAFTHIKAVLDLIADPASGKQLSLPGGMTVSKLYDRLIFSMPTDQPRESIAPDVVLHVPGVTRLPVRGMEISCECRDLEAGELEAWRREEHLFEQMIDLEKVHLPLIVRARRPGDRFGPLGAPGSKKLSEFLIDAKVTPAERKRVAVLCDQWGPIWIVGHRIDERVKLSRPSTRVLCIKVQPLDHGDGG